VAISALPQWPVRPWSTTHTYIKTKVVAYETQNTLFRLFLTEIDGLVELLSKTIT
jgi:hypothetical protein